MSGLAIDFLEAARRDLDAGCPAELVAERIDRALALLREDLIPRAPLRMRIRRPAGPNIPPGASPHLFLTRPPGASEKLFL